MDFIRKPTNVNGFGVHLISILMGKNYKLAGQLTAFK